MIVSMPLTFTLYLETPGPRLMFTEAKISSFFEAKSMILNPCLSPLILISGVMMPAVFLSEILFKIFWIKVDLPHLGLPVIKIFIFLQSLYGLCEATSIFCYSINFYKFCSSKNNLAKFNLLWHEQTVTA